jgi:hypothetical protein
MKSHYDQEGFRAEEMITRWLAMTGYLVKTSTWQEDVKEDIDIWVKGRQFTHWTSVSIKSQAVGIVYGTLGFELGGTRGMGWFNTGKAEQYLIIRDPQFIPKWRLDILGQVPMTYQPKFIWLPKQRVQYHLESVGWAYKRGLSPAVLARQNGRDAVSGYLYCKDILKRSDIEVLPRGWCAMVEGE